MSTLKTDDYKITVTGKICRGDVYHYLLSDDHPCKPTCQLSHYDNLSWSSSTVLYPIVDLIHEGYAKVGDSVLITYARETHTILSADLLKLKLQKEFKFR